MEHMILNEMGFEFLGTIFMGYLTMLLLILEKVGHARHMKEKGQILVNLGQI